MVNLDYDIIIIMTLLLYLKQAAVTCNVFYHMKLMDGHFKNMLLIKDHIFFNIKNALNLYFNKVIRVTVFCLQHCGQMTNHEMSLLYNAIIKPLEHTFCVQHLIIIQETEHFYTKVTHTTPSSPGTSDTTKKHTQKRNCRPCAAGTSQKQQKSPLIH